MPRAKKAESTQEPPVEIAAETAPAAEEHHEGPFTLCIDIGGTGLKVIVVDAKGEPMCERQRIPTPRPATPQAVLSALGSLLDKVPAFDRVSAGFPGVVVDNTTLRAPNLDAGWEGFALGDALTQLTKKPARVINDAGVQGYGVVEGRGVEMVITLGTGMGCALFLDGRYVPNLELAHHPFKKGKTYEQRVGNKAFESIGKRRWRRRVHQVIKQVLPIWNPRALYLGGGNARHLKKDELPSNVKIVENIAGLLGGIALWR
ncbi:MAG: ROK family protein [Polyangiaceae bacterium]